MQGDARNLLVQRCDLVLRVGVQKKFDVEEVLSGTKNTIQESSVYSELLPDQ